MIGEDVKRANGCINRLPLPSENEVVQQGKDRTNSTEKENETSSSSSSPLFEMENGKGIFDTYGVWYPSGEYSRNRGSYQYFICMWLHSLKY